MKTRTSKAEAAIVARPNSEKIAVVYETENDLPGNTRSEVIGLINRRLADIIDLQTQLKQAHWNVKGPHFIGLHELFDKVAEDVENYVDLIAERIVQLGGIAEGTVRVAAERSRLDEYPLDIADGTAHIEAVARALSTFGREARMTIEETQGSTTRTRQISSPVSRDRQMASVCRSLTQERVINSGIGQFGL
jgi:starvation-inducible DNA-binding protein